MKKRLFIILFISIVSLKLFAQNSDLKYYSDFINNFSGYAVAVYYGNIQDTQYKTEKEVMNYISESCEGKLTRVYKLTKNNNWLYKQAMNEWDYEKGELYGVICADSLFSTNGIFFFVLVNGKDDFSWLAYYIDTDEDYQDLFSD